MRVRVYSLNEYIQKPLSQATEEYGLIFIVAAWAPFVERAIKVRTTLFALNYNHPYNQLVTPSKHAPHFFVSFTEYSCYLLVEQ